MPTPLKPAVTKEQYEAMSEPEKLVALAEDVLAQLDAGLLAGRHGTYFEGAGIGMRAKGRTVQRRLLASTKTCHVCAVGALLVAKARIADDVTGEELLDGDRTATDASYDSIRLVEHAFEGWDEDDQLGILPPPDISGFQELATDRLRTLMQFIVDKKGVLSANT